MSKINSKQKGKRGELEAVNFLKEEGFTDARRGQQFKGTEDSPDVISKLLAGYHLEIKRSENINIYKAIEQAIKDAGSNFPLVLHRRSRKPWLAIMPAERWAAMEREIQVLRFNLSPCNVKNLEKSNDN